MESTKENLSYLNFQLIEATQKGHLEQIKKLIAKGASKNVRDACENTLLMMATQADSLEIVEYFANLGVDLDATNIFNHSAYSIAETNFRYEIKHFLISFKNNQTLLFDYNNSVGIGNMSSSSPDSMEVNQNTTHDKKSKSKIFKYFGF